MGKSPGETAAGKQIPEAAVPSLEHRKIKLAALVAAGGSASSHAESILKEITSVRADEQVGFDCESEQGIGSVGKGIDSVEHWSSMGQ